MAKHNPKGRSNSGGRHIRLYQWELLCPAYRALKPNEIAVYLEVRRRYTGKNNGYISFSTREAAIACHAGNSTGARAMNRLIQLGFLKITMDSTFGQKRLAREYELTALSTKPAKPDQFLTGTKDFMRWTEKAIREHDKTKPKRKNHSPTHEAHSPTRGKRGANIVKLRAV